MEGAAKVDMVSIILIIFNDTNKLNDKKNVYNAKKDAPLKEDITCIGG